MIMSIKYRIFIQERNDRKNLMYRILVAALIKK